MWEAALRVTGKRERKEREGEKRNKKGILRKEKGRERERIARYRERKEKKPKKDIKEKETGVRGRRKRNKKGERQRRVGEGKTAFSRSFSWRNHFPRRWLADPIRKGTNHVSGLSCQVVNWSTLLKLLIHCYLYLTFFLSFENTNPKINKNISQVYRKIKIPRRRKKTKNKKTTKKFFSHEILKTSVIWHTDPGFDLIASLKLYTG